MALLLLLAQVALLLLFFHLCVQFAKVQLARARLPPGPAPFPVIGSLWALRFQLHPEILMKLAKTYGNTMTIWMGMVPIVVFSGYEAVRDMLVSNSDETSGRPLTPYIIEFGNERGILVSNGHISKQQRRFTGLKLRSLGVGKKIMENRIQEEAQHLVELFAAHKEKVQRELDSVIGNTEIMHYEHRKKLPYTNAVVHETQRLSCIVVFGLPRVCVKDTTVQGFPIKKGALLMYNLFSVLHDHTHWEKPEVFNPSRFLDEDGNFVNKEAFIPFSAGHRSCLGEQMARVELFIFFTSLLREFSFRLPDGVKNVNLDYTLGTVLHPVPYKICATPRKCSSYPSE